MRKTNNMNGKILSKSIALIISFVMAACILTGCKTITAPDGKPSAEPKGILPENAIDIEKVRSEIEMTGSDVKNDKNDEKLKKIEEMMERAKEAVAWKEIEEFNPDGEFSGIRAITYEGEKLGSKNTKIFAYLGIPEGADTTTPAIVLIHGGGGHAFLQWVKLWMDRGYTVIAPDVTGYFPSARNAGNTEVDNRWVRGLKGVFKEEGYTICPDNDGMSTSSQNVDRQWMYHALAATGRAFTVLEKSGYADPEKIGMTGISWGGTIAAIYIGYDERPAFAIPIYGSAFLEESLSWIKDNFKEEATRYLWSASKRLESVKYPVLWLCWDDDCCFSLSANSKSYLVSVRQNGDTRLSAVNNMQHSHSCAWIRQESYVFADMVTGKISQDSTAALPLFVTLPEKGSVECFVKSCQSATVYYLTEEMVVTSHEKHGFTSTFIEEEWKSADLKVSRGNISGNLPSDALYYYIAAKNKDGLVVTSHLVKND